MTNRVVIVYILQYKTPNHCVFWPA